MLANQSDMRKRKATIEDIAARIGVHWSTVSRVLNPATRSMVSEKVGRRVLEMAKKLGYTRNILAAGLKNGRTYTVGIVIPDLTNPLFPPIVRAIERTLQAAGYIAILADTDNSSSNERAIIQTLVSRRVDGLILATALRKDELIESYINDQLPLVLVNRTIKNDGATAVINDDEFGIKLAFEHLVDLGHRRIAYLGGPMRMSTSYARYQAFLGASRAHGIPINRALVVNASALTEQSGRAAVDQILSQGASLTAILTANDRLALGCYDALREKHLRCPDDVSVTGFNDMPYVERLTPPLTTLHVPHDEMGTLAASLLLDQLGTPKPAAKQVRLRPSLVVRGSTAPPPRKPKVLRRKKGSPSRRSLQS
jgi:LacI family transcriptional regulator